MNNREVMQKALRALEQCGLDDTHRSYEFEHAARAALRAALAEPQDEPVAKVELMKTGGNAGLATRIVEIDDHLRERLRPGQMLYTRKGKEMKERIVVGSDSTKYSTTEPDPRQSAYEVEYWRQRYEMLRQRYELLVNKVMDAQPVMAPPTLLTHAESYEAGRLHGAIAEREACAKTCEARSLRDDDMGAILARAIRARSKE